MLFKKLVILQLTGPFPTTEENLSHHLDKHRFQSGGPAQYEKTGWTSPFGGDDETLVFSAANTLLVCLKVETKILPEKVVRDDMEETVRERERAGQKVSRKDRQQLMEESRRNLLPKALSQFKTIRGYFDIERNEVVVASTSPKDIDLFTSSMRRSIGSLKVQFCNPGNHYIPTMTEWAVNNELPEKTQYGDAITLISIADKAKGRFTNQDLSSDEIRACLESGKVVTSIHLSWNDYLSFVVEEGLYIKNIKTLDSFDTWEDGGERIDTESNYLLTVGGIRTLTKVLFGWFDIQAPEIEDEQFEDGPSHHEDPYESYDEPPVQNSDADQYEHLGTPATPDDNSLPDEEIA